MQNPDQQQQQPPQYAQQPQYVQQQNTNGGVVPQQQQPMYMAQPQPMYMPMPQQQQTGGVEMQSPPIQYVVDPNQQHIMAAKQQQPQQPQNPQGYPMMYQQQQQPPQQMRTDDSNTTTNSHQDIDMRAAQAQQYQYQPQPQMMAPQQYQMPQQQPVYYAQPQQPQYAPQGQQIYQPQMMIPQQPQQYAPQQQVQQPQYMTQQAPQQQNQQQQMQPMPQQPQMIQVGVPQQQQQPQQIPMQYIPQPQPQQIIHNPHQQQMQHQMSDPMQHIQQQQPQPHLVQQDVVRHQQQPIQQQNPQIPQYMNVPPAQPQQIHQQIPQQLHQPLQAPFQHQHVEVPQQKVENRKEAEPVAKTQPLTPQKQSLQTGSSNTSQQQQLNLPESLIAQTNASHEERKGIESSSIVGGAATGLKSNEETGNDQSKIIDTAKRGHLAFITANTYQIANLNKLLPPGFQIQLHETVQKNYEAKLAAQKKAQLAPKKKKVAPITQVSSGQQSSMAALTVTKKGGPTTLSGAPIIGSDLEHDLADGHHPKVAQKTPAAVASVKSTQHINSSPVPNALTKAASVTSAQGGGGGSAQRISARDKKPIDYGQMAAGTSDISASMDYGEVSGQNSRTIQKKASNNVGPNNVPLSNAPGVDKVAQAKLVYEQQLLAHQNAVQEVEKTQTKCQQMFNFLGFHPNVTLFNNPPDITNSKVLEMMTDPSYEFQNLVSIKNKFTEGQYQSTFKLVNDLRKMCSNYRNLYKEDQDKQEKITDIQKYLDQIFANLDIENKSLVAPPPPVYEQPQITPPPLARQPSSSGAGSSQQPQAKPARAQEAKKSEKIQQELNRVKDLSTPSLAKAASSKQPQAQQPPPAKQPAQQQPSFDMNAAARNQRAQSQIENIIMSAKQSTVSDKPMNIEEKNSLKNSIGHLTEEQQRGIIGLVQDCLTANGGEVFEFELDQLPAKKCRELENYVKKCIQVNQKKEKRKMADQARRQAQKQQQQLKSTSSGATPQPPVQSSAAPVQQPQIQNIPVQKQTSYQGEVNIAPQGIPMQITQPQGAPQQQYLIQQPQQQMQPQQQAFGQQMMQPQMQPNQGIIQGVGIPGQVIGQPLYGNQMMLGQLPQQTLGAHQMPQNQAQLMMMMQQQNQMQMQQQQMQPQQQIPGMPMGQQQPMLQPQQMMGQQNALQNQQQLQQQTLQQGATQYPRVQSMEPNRFAMRGSKGQKAAASDSESDSDSSSSDSDSDKDKKKNNLKHRTSSQMLGGAPGVNPGSSNLNNMWKRGGQ